MSIENSALFSGISQSEIEKMISCFHAELKKYSAGETIYDFSANDGKIGIMEKGSAQMLRIDINGNRAMLQHLEDGAIFGNEIAFSQTSEDSIYVECEKDCEVLFLPCSSITAPCCNACEHHSKLLKNLLFIMSAELLSISRRVEVLSHRSIRDKLMCYFGICASINKSQSFPLPFSMNLLAEYICSDRSAMMREIKNMKNDGLIEINKKIVTMLQ